MSAALKAQRGKFDLLLSTVNVTLNWQAYLATLAPNGTVHMLGLPLEPMQIPAGMLIGGADGSPVHQQVHRRHYVSYSNLLARKNMRQQIEVFQMSQLNQAIEHLHSGKARYRIVLKARFTA